MIQLPKRNRRGFTLVEMLIAMAVTLLLMAALAKSFGFVGTRVKESRSNVALANNLRDFTTRIGDELASCTVPLVPANGVDEPHGYFVYSEGPVTNATSSLFRAFNDASGNLQLNDARYGDCDDYLAFTAVAQGDGWFTGKVPRFVLDQKTAQLNGATYDPLSFPGDPWDPIVIRSKYAEIVYFASPEYVQASLPATPQYVDVDGDTDLDGDGDASENGFPDRMRLHRRVLLIRPDLNLNNLNITGRSAPTSAIPGRTMNGVPFLQADTWPTGSATLSTAATAADAWLFGMAGCHQQCDLSLRRVLSDSGLPTTAVAANTLADLSKPHNRFAHVRVPGNVLLGGTAPASPTSMPVLALGNPLTVLNATTSGGNRIAPPATPNVGPVVTPALSGFLRPEFVLGEDFSHLDSSLDVWGRERRGEDVYLNNVVAFDLKVYDPNVAFFTTSTGLVVGPDDAGYREALREKITDPTPRQQSNGGYVDLAYAILAGGSLRGWQARYFERRSSALSPVIPPTGGYLITPFSAVRSYSGTDSRNAFQNSIYRSGRLVTLGTTIRLFQPAFDTFTSHYERDGFLQGFNGGSGTNWSGITSFATVDLGADGLDTNTQQASDDVFERETLPPFNFRPESVQVSLRLENPSTRQMRQSSVVHRDPL